MQWTNKQVKDVIARYEAGEHPSKIAPVYRVSSVSIYQVLYRNGIKSARARRMEANRTRNQIIFLLAVKGQSWASIGREYNISPAHARRIAWIKGFSKELRNDPRSPPNLLVSSLGIVPRDID